MEMDGGRERQGRRGEPTNNGREKRRIDKKREFEEETTNGGWTVLMIEKWIDRERELRREKVESRRDIDGVSSPGNESVLRSLR